jgi:hypothetical protein
LPDSEIDRDKCDVIHVMVVYTKTARVAAGSVADMEAIIDLAIAETITAYEDSNVSLALDLVRTVEVNFTESTDFSAMLEALRNPSDRSIDGIHALRDSDGADVVSMIVEEDTLCGVANIMRTLSPAFESSAFSVVNRECAVGKFSFAHELGHNMGSEHDRADANDDGVFLDSFGYQDPSETFRTIMSTNCPNGCLRIQKFSNPNILFGGVPTGIDHTADPNNSANNARSLNAAKCQAAAWRCWSGDLRIEECTVRIGGVVHRGRRETNCVNGKWRENPCGAVIGGGGNIP